MTPAATFERASELLNIQYGVCFGAIFTVLLRVDPNSLHNINFAVPGANVASFLMLVVYFFLDWLGANFIQGKTPSTANRVLMVSLWVWFLGLVVVFSAGGGYWKYLLTGLYFIGASLYHGYLYVKPVHAVSVGPLMIGCICLAISFQLAISSLLTGLLFYYGIISISGSGALAFHYIVVSQVIWKGVHLFLLRLP